MKDSEILTLAKAKIQDPANWVKERYATDKHGSVVGSWTHAATCFCSKGAILNMSRHIPLGRVEAASDWLNLAANSLTKGSVGSVITFNDHPGTTHADVMKLWDLAIELAKENEK